MNEAPQVGSLAAHFDDDDGDDLVQLLDAMFL